MKLVKSLLLGSAAGLAAVAGAQAADLPSKKAAPVEYVRVCSAHGAGFFYIPGSDTCIKLLGTARVEYLMNQMYNRTNNAYGSYAMFRMAFDARNSTEYGLLRAYMQLQATYSNGAYGAAIPGYQATWTGAGTTNSVALRHAYIQLGGITAGRLQSFYDFYADNFNWGGATSTIGSDKVNNVLAYTATFGSGFSATLSLEDSTNRNLATTTAIANGIGYNATGATMPDIVANLRVDQSWGSAQLSGAVHQVRAAYGTSYTTGSADYGFAVQGGVKINLPMIAAGDQLWLQAAYAQGAMSYAAVGNTSMTVGNLKVNTADAYYVNGNLNMSTAFAFTGAFVHYWSPILRSVAWAQYQQVDLPGAIASTAGNTNSNNTQAGLQLIWSPVKGLDIGGEVAYFYLSANTAQVRQDNSRALLSSDSGWQGRLRIQRDF